MKPEPSELYKLREEVEQLRRWKAEQMAVESLWDEQAVGKLLGVPMGQSIKPQIQPRVETMLGVIGEAHEALSILGDCRILHSSSDDTDNYATEHCLIALAKLQPFITPTK